MKGYFKELKSLHWGQLAIMTALSIGIIILSIMYTWILAVLGIGALIFIIWALIKNGQFQKQAVGNGIIFGGRGKGKGLLLNKRINTDPNKKHFTNVPYNAYSEIIDIKEYIDSIIPITTEDFINNTIKPIKKIEKYEGINVYWDDVGVYAPNFMDHQLKRYYPSLSALLPINRHLYDAYMIIITQDYNRPYKLLRELQTDFAIKAIKTRGTHKSYLWNSIPFLRHFIYTKYIYYENNNAAIDGKLPFNAKAVVNEGLKHGYLTSGQATKEQYEAENGLIRYGAVLQLKKNVNYDSRHFHEVVYGYKADEEVAE